MRQAFAQWGLQKRHWRLTASLDDGELKWGEGREEDGQDRTLSVLISFRPRSWRPAGSFAAAYE